ncbi:MAG TPA: YqgE/AlgH family protein [Gaiellaceae bacterium]|nr:YqgE/AlgH family protein [Gaiellaceae bacterium]
MDSLRGQLLIASASLVDPNFRRTVVLVAEHGDEGAMGLVLNRPSPTEVAEAVPALEVMVEPGDTLYLGGPVQPESVVVLGEFREPDEAAVVVTGRIGFMPADSDPEDVAAATDRIRVYAGYAGWAAGQLEAELEEESWIVEPARPDDVFGDAGDLWGDVLRRKGGRYRVLALMPDDPSAN